MAFLLIEGLIDVVELIGSAVAADSAAVAGSGIAGVAGETASLAVAGGATVAVIGHQMAQKTSRQTTIGSGEIPQTPSVIDDGTRNVVYDPGAAPTPSRVVYQPMINSSGRGDTRHVDGTDDGGFYGGVWFGRQKKKRRRQFM
jgi:imidazole glycerol phosphate synthase subunit HisF